VEEVCDRLDNNCDGQIDEGFDRPWMLDADDDGFGGLDDTSCLALDGFTNRGGELIDCDDQNSAIHPRAVEICDTIDNNCDGQIDEGVQITVYADLDADGFGDPENPVHQCPDASREGLLAFAGDCDDLDAEISPDAAEICDDLLDNDCDTLRDEPGCTVEAIGILDEDVGWIEDLTQNVQIMGDINCDGVSDVLVGTKYDNVLLYGPLTSPGRFSDVGVPVYPEQDWDRSYAELFRGYGDLDGDGCADLLATGHHRTGELSAENRNYLLYGPVEGAVHLKDADRMGHPYPDGIARSLHWIGDTNGDGSDEAHEYVDTPDGRVSLLWDIDESGTLHAAPLAFTTQPDMLYIREIDPLGDTNGDGLTDYLIHQSYGIHPEYDESDPDIVYGSYGGPFFLEGPLLDGQTFIVSDTEMVFLDLSALGDVDGDGYDDVRYIRSVLSGPLTDGSGVTAHFDDLGITASDIHAFDYDNDGDNDLLVGAPHHGDPARLAFGRAYLFTGPVEGSLTEADAARIFVANVDLNVNVIISAGADLTGDGIEDAAIGMPNHTPYPGAPGPSALYILPGL
ncbi:MAG: putative metal-binding motif-containing protein, partial [Myxococcota bacterium]